MRKKERGGTGKSKGEEGKGRKKWEGQFRGEEEKGKG